LLPAVGNVLAPLAGVGLGQREWALAQFGIGLLLWPLILGLLLARLVHSGMWPERLRASVFVLVAPPAVIGSGLLVFGAPPEAAWLAWGVAVLMLFLALRQLPAIRSQGFHLAWWSASFPVAAFAALTLRLHAGLGIALLALASVLMLGLFLATWRAWRGGQLWVSEPAAPTPSVSI
jgi:tellurite resistance protein